MITVLKTLNPAGGPIVHQERLQPSVYLDHWAFRRISETPALAARFRNSLVKRDGTLAISFVNWGEFAKVSDIRQIRAAEEFLTSIMPRIFFINSNFLEVMSRENDPRYTGPGRSPDGDGALFSDFTRENPLSIQYKLLVLSYNRDDMQHVIEATAKAVLLALSAFFKQNDDAKARTEISDKIKTAIPARRTYAFAMAAYEFLYGRRHGRFNENDAIDLLHTIVPATYCTYALLDGSFCHLVQSVGRRLNEIAEFPFARVFSERDSGIERFLTDLESGNTERAS